MTAEPMVGISEHAESQRFPTCVAQSPAKLQVPLTDGHSAPVFANKRVATAQAVQSHLNVGLIAEFLSNGQCPLAGLESLAMVPEKGERRGQRPQGHAFGVPVPGPLGQDNTSLSVTLRLNEVIQILGALRAPVQDCGQCVGVRRSIEHLHTLIPYLQSSR